MEQNDCQAHPVPNGPLTSWEQICHYYYKELPNFKCKEDKKENPRWLFRGDIVSDQSPLSCKLTSEPPGQVQRGAYGELGDAFLSRLDRAFKEFDVRTCQEKHEIEWGLMRTFRRRAHLHTGSRDDNWLERLGLMAHYQAPHRLLDWNYSFFNALYFAVNGEYQPEIAVIWAINKRWLSAQARAIEGCVLKSTSLSEEQQTAFDKLKEEGGPQFESKIVHFLMLSNKRLLVYPVTPYYQNERLSIQQGTLLCAGSINKSWGTNLERMLRRERKQLPLVKIPIKLTPYERKHVLNELNSMNINQATLFPDLDGFARSLRTRLADPESIKIDVPPVSALKA